MRFPIFIYYCYNFLYTAITDLEVRYTSVIRLGYESVIGLGYRTRLRCQNMSDVIDQFSLIAYGRMFTPDWEDVLKFSYHMLLHDQTCFPVWKMLPVSY